MKVLSLLALLVPIYANALTLAWDPSAGAEGYNLYCGETPSPAPAAVDVGNVTTHSPVLAESVEYECWVTAYIGQLESGHSNHIVFTVPGAPQTIVLPAAPGAITITW